MTLHPFDASLVRAIDYDQALPQPLATRIEFKHAIEG